MQSPLQDLTTPPAFPDDLAPTRQRVALLGTPIRAAHAAGLEAAEAAIQNDRLYAVLADAGPKLEAPVWRRHDADVRAIQADHNLSLTGREAKLAEVRRVRVAATDRIRVDVLERVGDQLLARFPASPMPMLPATVAANATFITSAADGVLPESFMNDALDLLRRVTDPATPAAEAFESNLLLNAAYAARLERYAAAPPKHWAGWSDVAGEVAELIRLHIATTWRRAHSDYAAAAVASFRDGFTWLDRSAEQAGRWDDVLRLGAPQFTWPALAAA